MAQYPQDTTSEPGIGNMYAFVRIERSADDREALQWELRGHRLLLRSKRRLSFSGQPRKEQLDVLLPLQ